MNQIQDEPVINEALWNEWLQRGKRNDQATVHTTRIVMGVVVALLLAGGAWLGMAR